jgi:hypothetical protein
MAGPSDDRALEHSRPCSRYENAFRDAFLLLDRRISLFLNLPLSKRSLSMRCRTQQW